MRPASGPPAVRPGATEHGRQAARSVAFGSDGSASRGTAHTRAAAGGVLDPIEANSATTRARKLSCPRCACGGNGLWSMLTAATVVTTARGAGTTPRDSGAGVRRGLSGASCSVASRPAPQARQRRGAEAVRQHCRAVVSPTDGSAAAGSDAALLTAPVTRPCIATATS